MPGYQKLTQHALPFIKQIFKFDPVTNRQIKCNLFLLTCLYWKRELAEQPILSLFGYLFLHYLLLFQNLGVGLQSQGGVATEIKNKILCKRRTPNYLEKYHTVQSFITLISYTKSTLVTWPPLLTHNLYYVVFNFKFQLQCISF